MIKAMLIFFFLATPNAISAQAKGDALTYTLDMCLAPMGGAVGGMLFQLPFRIPLAIITMSGSDPDPTQNKVALGFFIAGAAATEVGFCLGSAYTVKLIGKARGYNGSFGRAAAYSLLGGGVSVILTGTTLLIRKKMDAVTIPVFIISAGFFPTIGSIIGYHSTVETEPSPSSPPLHVPQPILKCDLLRFRF